MPKRLLEFFWGRTLHVSSGHDPVLERWKANRNCRSSSSQCRRAPGEQGAENGGKRAGNRFTVTCDVLALSYRSTQHSPFLWVIVVTVYRAPGQHVMFRALCGSSSLVLETRRCGASVLVLQPRGVGRREVKVTRPVSLDTRLRSVVFHSGTSCAPAGGVRPTLHVVRFSVRLLGVSSDVLIKRFYGLTSFYSLSSLCLSHLRRRDVASMTVWSFDTWRPMETDVPIAV